MGHPHSRVIKGGAPGTGVAYCATQAWLLASIPGPQTRGTGGTLGGG
jgi:hypothetical protein